MLHAIGMMKESLQDRFRKTVSVEELAVEEEIVFEIEKVRRAFRDVLLYACQAVIGLVRFPLSTPKRLLVALPERGPGSVLCAIFIQIL